MSNSNVLHFFERLRRSGDKVALISNECEFSFCQLLQMVDRWDQELDSVGVGSGDVVAWNEDFSPRTISLFLSAIKRGAISAPLPSKATDDECRKLCDIAQVDFLFCEKTGKSRRFTRKPTTSDASRAQKVLDELRIDKTPGLIVLSSGSTGDPKAILHSIEKILSRYQGQGKPLRCILMLGMDHFGGINTLLGCLHSSSAAACISTKTPAVVCQTVQNCGIELLPTTPTFLNMLLLAQLQKAYDLSSLKVITYGAEPMLPHVLRMLATEIPHVKLKQTYGLSELGVLNSSSPSRDSLWVRIGNDNFETRVVNGVLHIRSKISMIGYLNYPNPFDKNGWFNTGDVVEVDPSGQMVRFVGRESEVINIGGEKVFPVEIENIIIEAENILEVAVSSGKHPILGTFIKANLTIAEPESIDQLTARLRKFCKERMSKHKVPTQFKVIPHEGQLNNRAKKNRSL